MQYLRSRFEPSLELFCMGGCVSRPLIEIQVGNVHFYTKSIINEGGFGIVYHVEERKTSESLAVKVISTKNDENLISKVRYEIGMLKNFRHTKEIIHLIAVDYNADGDYFLVFPYFPRGSLADLLIDFRKFNLRLTTERIIFFLSHIINGLIWLHTLGYIHRDLKPANFVLNEKDHVVIIDLGSVMRKNIIIGNNKERDRLIDECNEKCSLLYRPPELFTCELGSYITEKVDIWMLGCCIYEFIYNRSPMEAVHASGNSVALAALSPERFPYSNDHCTDDTMLDIVRRMLKSEPGKRMSLRQLRDTVNNIQRFEPEEQTLHCLRGDGPVSDFKEPAPFINEDGSFLPSVPEQEEGTPSEVSSDSFGDYVYSYESKHNVTGCEIGEDEDSDNGSDGEKEPPPPITPRGPVPFNPMRFYIKQAADRCRNKYKKKFANAQKMGIVKEEPEDSSKTPTSVGSPMSVPRTSYDPDDFKPCSRGSGRDFDYFYLPPRGKPTLSNTVPEKGQLQSKQSRSLDTEPQVQFSARFIENYLYFKQNGFCIPMDNLPCTAHSPEPEDSPNDTYQNLHSTSPIGSSPKGRRSSNPDASSPQRIQSTSPNNSSPNSPNPRKKYTEPRPSPYHYLPFEPWSTGTVSPSEQKAYFDAHSETFEVTSPIGNRTEQSRPNREASKQQKKEHKGYHDPFLMLEPPPRKPDPEIPLICNIREVIDRPDSPFVLWRQCRADKTRMTKRKVDETLRQVLSPVTNRDDKASPKPSPRRATPSKTNNETTYSSKKGNISIDPKDHLSEIPDTLPGLYEDSDDDDISTDSDSSTFKPREGGSNVPYA